MNQEITFLTLFLLGFFGGTHCVGMCGGLSSAFALQLPPHLNRIGLIALLNLGRISSYVVIGLLVGLVGQVGISLDDTRAVQNGLYIAANVLLLLLGLYLAGISTAATKIEGIGACLFRRGRALGLAALRFGLQRVFVCLGQRQCLARRAVYAGVCIGDLAEPACDGHICSAVENLSAETHGSFVRRIVGGRMGDMALGCICDGANRVR